MKQQNNPNVPVSQAVSRVQTAYKKGQLSEYYPLKIAKTEGDRSTCLAAWGPANKK
jgi:hypothetical protein